MVQPQGMYDPDPTAVDLRVNEADYFGVPLRDIEASSRSAYGLLETARTDLYRVSYVYQQVFKNKDEYGGIQARARTFLHIEDGAVPTVVQRHVQRSAHRAAYLFDSTLEEGIYGGYLTGFNGWEAEDGDKHDYQNWEVERVTGVDSTAAGVGAIDWSLEIYLDEKDGDEFTGFAGLSGLATGTTNPWRVTTSEEPGRQPIHVPPHKWRMSWNQSREQYQLAATGRSQARERYQPGGAGHDKLVYINEKPVGRLDSEGRTWLKPEYARGDGHTTSGGFGTYWSREGLVAETDATYSALRKGGVLYLTGETREGIYLSTARAKPDDWSGANPNDVPVGMEVDEGAPPVTRHLLDAQDPGEPLQVNAASDDQIIKHLGYSTPPYTHHVSGDGWMWPGFRPVEEYANLAKFHPDPLGPDESTADPWTDDTTQTGLDGYDEGSR